MKKLLYFTAPWCSVCKTMSPIIDKLISSGANIIKIDVSQDQATASMYGVQSLPNFVLLKNDKPAGQLIGRQTEASITDLLK